MNADVDYLLTLTDDDSGEASVTVGVCAEHAHLYVHPNIYNDGMELTFSVEETDELINALMEACEMIEENSYQVAEIEAALDTLFRAAFKPSAVAAAVR